MKLVGIIGEHPHDTEAVANLLVQKFADIVHFKTLLREIHGSMLDSQKTKHLLRKAYENNQADVIVFVRDLDAFEDNREKKLERQTYFNESNKVIDGRGIFLLNIQTLEALIFSDIEQFNAFAKSELRFVDNPMKIDNPKRELKENSSYSEGQCPEIFKHIRIDTVAQNCHYFREFLNEFEKRIA
jgi:hypothetical protein